MTLDRLFNRVRSWRGGRSEPGPSDRTFIVVGLGNPGPKYAGTRHNAGFLCIDRLAERLDVKLKPAGRQTLLAEAALDGVPVVLAKPQTYVNRSGEAVVYLLRRFNAGADRLVVVYDEMSLPIGRLRVRRAGAAAGHNGIKSIIAATSTQEFARVRIGIGKPDDAAEHVDHVLSRFRPDERQVISEAVDRASDAVAAIVRCGVEKAMNDFNRPP